MFVCCRCIFKFSITWWSQLIILINIWLLNPQEPSGSPTTKRPRGRPKGSTGKKSAKSLTLSTPPPPPSTQP
uniref:Uncharacterized protein n=1 Tax=Myripristis murdjan TaxID=586833 RepID=A0A667ZIP2_9TELE